MSFRFLGLIFFRHSFPRLISHLAPIVFGLIPILLSQFIPNDRSRPFLATNAQILSSFLIPDSTCPIIASKIWIFLLLKSLCFSLFSVGWRLYLFANSFCTWSFVNMVIGDPVSIRAWTSFRFNFSLMAPRKCSVLHKLFS